MSFPTFSDFNKSILDTLKDDFDTKVRYTLKVKATAPKGVTITQTTEHINGKLSGKVSAKWAGQGGFNLDKFEVKSDGSITTETSLSNLARGVKLEFKGNDKNLGDLGVTYEHAHLTATAVVDVANFDTATASVHGGANNVTAGANAVVKVGEKSSLQEFNVLASYSMPKQFFLGFLTQKKFTDFGLSLNYVGLAKYTFVGKANYAPADHKSTFEVGAVYKCCCHTTMKAKVDQAGLVSLSLKQALENKTVLVGAVQADPRDISSLKFGLSATIG